MPLWVVLSLLSLAANAAKVLIVKRLCGGIDSRLVVLAGRLFSGVVLLPILFWSGGTIPTSGWFWAATTAAAVITAFASVLFTEAVKKGTLALVIPAQAAVPVFTLLTLWAAGGKTPTSAAVVLMLLSMAAVGWMLYANHRGENPAHRQTFYALLSLLAAALFGVSTVLDRVAIANAVYGALAYSAIWNLLSAALVGLECLRTNTARKTHTINPKIFWPLTLYGLTVLASFFTQQLAVQQSLNIAGAVVNVKSIVMLHLPVVLLIGILFFGERIIRQAAIAGAAALLFGIALVRAMLQG